MSESGGRGKPTGHAGTEGRNSASQQFGSAWIELQVPARVSWVGKVEGECRVEAMGNPVNIPLLRFTTMVRAQDSDGTSWAQSMNPVDHRVVLAVGEQTILRITMEIPRRAGMLTEGQLSLFASGARWWSSGTTLTVPFQLVLPAPFDELAGHLAACSGFSQVSWSTPYEYGERGDFVARLTRPGERHRLLTDLRLEVMDAPGEIRGCLDVGERFQGLGASILGPDRKRHAFAFAAGEVEQAKQFLEAILRPYDPERRRLPIPGREPASQAHLKLPLPASRAKDEAQNLPAPSHEPEGK